MSMDEGTEMTNKTSVAHIVGKDVTLVVDMPTGYYLLRLLVDDLRRSAGASQEWLSDVVGLACYLRDLLPEELRIPVPTVADIQRMQMPGWVGKPTAENPIPDGSVEIAT